MDVREKFQSSDVGMIPSDWNSRELGELGVVIRGASPRPKGDKRFYGGSVPRLMVEDVTRDGKFVEPKVDFLTDEGAKRSRPCKKGTLTIVCSGTVGVPSFLAVDACIHDGFLALINLKYVHDDYVYHQLNQLREAFDQYATHGGVFTNLTTTGVSEFKIPLPPTLAEQQAIAEALSDADALIESLEQLIAKKRQIKQGAMQELLTGKRRLPGFEGEWESATLGELVDLVKLNVNPATTPEDEYEHFSLPAFDSGKKPVKQRGREIGSNKFKVPLNSILVSKLNPRIPRIWAPSLIPPNAICSTEFLVLLPKDGVSRSFVFCLCSSARFRGQLDLHATGTTGSHQRISPNQALSMGIDFPVEKNEQDAIATIFRELDLEIDVLLDKLSKARLLKQGMMQELLTGRIRLV